MFLPKSNNVVKAIPLFSAILGFKACSVSKELGDKLPRI